MKYAKTMLMVLMALGVASFVQADAFESGLWPGEGRPVFIARQNLTVQEKPAKDSVMIEKVKIRKGQKIDYKETRYRTLKSGLMTVTAPSTLSVTSYGRLDFLSSDDYLNNGIKKSIKLKAGDAMDYLQYRAEGECFIKMNGEVFALTPDENIRISIEPEVEWWVLAVDKLNKPLGWVRVNEKTVEFAERQF